MEFIKNLEENLLSNTMVKLEKMQEEFNRLVLLIKTIETDEQLKMLKEVVNEIDVVTDLKQTHYMLSEFKQIAD